jgi:hypothetical protein
MQHLNVFFLKMQHLNIQSVRNMRTSMLCVLISLPLLVYSIRAIVFLAGVFLIVLFLKSIDFTVKFAFFLNMNTIS